jgi:hypothetical protein
MRACTAAKAKAAWRDVEQVLVPAPKHFKVARFDLVFLQIL